MRIDATDQHEIERLYRHYVRCIDDGDTDAFAHCFTPDGVLRRLDGEEVRGVTDLTQFVVDFRQRALDQRVQFRHLVTNILVEDTDPVSSSCYATLIAVDADGSPTLQLSVIYSDLLVKGENGWRFSSREVTADRG
jgi:uncharacterized protein (TIGR02246 family)